MNKCYYVTIANCEKFAQVTFLAVVNLSEKKSKFKACCT